jgi:hypothetical protein
MEEVVISTLVVSGVLGISAKLGVLLLIRVQRCFVSIIGMRMLGLDLNIIFIQIGFGLDIRTCYHMEEGKVPGSMVGSQDALLPLPIGTSTNQTMAVTIKIMQQ